MKFVRVRAGTVAAAVFWAQAALAECVFYGEPDFVGDSVAIENNIAVPRLGGYWNDRISSVKTSSECRAEIFEHWEYGGGAGLVETFVSFDEGAFWNDRTSSVRCVCAAPEPSHALNPLTEGGRLDAPPRWLGDGPAPQPSRRGAACLVFEEPEFTGSWRAFRDGESNDGLGRRLVRSVASVRVAKGCYVLFGVDDDAGYWTGRDIATTTPETVGDAVTMSCTCR